MAAWQKPHVGGTTPTAATMRAAARADRLTTPAHRPDLIDRLATLVARLAPGSGPARAAARLNRRLDTWALVRTPDHGRATVTAASPPAAETVIFTSDAAGTGSVTAAAPAARPA